MSRSASNRRLFVRRVGEVGYGPRNEELTSRGPFYQLLAQAVPPRGNPSLRGHGQVTTELGQSHLGPALDNLFSFRTQMCILELLGPR